MGLLSKVFGRSGDPRIDALKHDLMRGRDGAIRARAARALAEIGGPAVGILIDGLRHKSPGTRQQVAIVLGDIGDQRATLPLVAALHDVGWAAAKALGKIGDSRALEALHEAWQGPDPALSRAARDALMKMTGSERMKAIVGLIDQIRVSSAEAQVGELLTLTEPGRSRPISSYQAMEDAALELHRLQGGVTKEERQYLNERLTELDQNEDQSVRKCAKIARCGR